MIKFLLKIRDLYNFKFISIYFYEVKITFIDINFIIKYINY